MNSLANICVWNRNESNHFTTEINWCAKEAIKLLYLLIYFIAPLQVSDETHSL